MQSGTTVRITKGKFRGQLGTVVTTRDDKDGTQRIQVQTTAGLFSYMPTSLVATTETTAPTASATL